MTNRLGNPPSRRLACSGCGTEFICGLAETCWRAEEVARLPMPRDGGELTTTPSERIGRCTRMRRFLVSDPTDWNHSFTPDTRRTSPSLRPGLSFRYTQASEDRCVRYVSERSTRFICDDEIIRNLWLTSLDLFGQKLPLIYYSFALSRR